MWTGKILERQLESGTKDYLCYCYAICDILGRRRSRVYNVVTVQCITSIILNIQGQTWCSVGRNPKNAIGSSLLVLKQRIDLFKFRLQDRDIYFEIKYSTKNERTNIRIGGSRQG